MRATGLVFIIVSFALLVLLLARPDTFEPGGAPEKLRGLWAKDLYGLKQAKKLPQSWQQIKSVELVFGDQMSKEIMSEVDVPIELNPQGTMKLELVIDKWVDEKEYGLIIQHHLIEIKNNNTVWELGRTYDLTVQ